MVSMLTPMASDVDAREMCAALAVVLDTPRWMRQRLNRGDVSFSAERVDHDEFFGPIAAKTCRNGVTLQGPSRVLIVGIR